MTLTLEYSDPHPNSKIGRLRTELMYLHDRHRRDGTLPTSVRFLFSDKRVSEALMDLRETGLVPWGDIVDETARFLTSPAPLPWRKTG